MPKQLAIVLAAGKGTRMKSELPKVLVEVLGRPMIDYVLDALEQAGVDQTLVVVGYRGELVRAALAGRRGVAFVEQPEQLGTGHAVMVCREQLAAHQGPVLVVAGDSPLLQPDSLRNLFAAFAESRPACLVGTGHKTDPHGLGRIVRDSRGEFLAIVEERDASPQQRAITEVNMSCYLFNSADLLAALGELRADNAQKEYYITDAPGVLRAAGKDVRALPVLQACEVLSINTVEELQAVERAMRELRAASPQAVSER
jgi:bifunctional UDP-N-acetylglucosamine pyrophosphorylase/glucosamine-1-phosphate N-acetyltransferase/UDP-N-acetylglucosamine pyrophosphorylase